MLFPWKFHYLYTTGFKQLEMTSNSGLSITACKSDRNGNNRKMDKPSSIIARSRKTSIFKFYFLISACTQGSWA